LGRLSAALAGLDAQVLFVDDSTDATPDVIRGCGATANLPVCLLHREGTDRTGGLGGAVVAGLEATGAPWVVIMDGDLQHPPEVVPELVRSGVEGDVDIVVASRYTDAGRSDGLASQSRKLISQSATWLARQMFPGDLQTSDPMSGFFAVRRSSIPVPALHPDGFKILLELLLRIPAARVREVPYVFQPRHAGESKASVREGVRFLLLLVRLRTATAVPWLLRLGRFAAVGASGLLVNLAALHLLLMPKHHPIAALAAAIATQFAIAWNFVLAELWVFCRESGARWRRRMIRFWAINNVGLLLQLPLASAIVDLLGVGYLIATALALVVLVLARFVCCDRLLYSAPLSGPSSHQSERA
jgi:dolichol-phosphate mannosyltransferase